MATENSKIKNVDLFRWFDKNLTIERLGKPIKIEDVVSKVVHPVRVEILDKDVVIVGWKGRIIEMELDCTITGESKK